MIIEENDGPSEMKTESKKKYIIVKNHIRELTLDNGYEDTSTESSTEKKKHVTKTKKHSTTTKPHKASIDAEIKNTNVEQISKSDIEELRTVYKKCKSVLRTIETKYGHLLEDDSEDSTTIKSRKHKIDDSDEECRCSTNKKIIFNEQGEQSYIESLPNNHICPNKLKCRTTVTNIKTRQIEVEYEQSRSLPDDLQALSAILQDRSIEKTYRNEVINKIRGIKQAHINDIRFDKPMMIHKLKHGSVDVFEFKGSNLLSLSGYPNPKQS